MRRRIRACAARRFPQAACRHSLQTRAPAADARLVTRRTTAAQALDRERVVGKGSIVLQERGEHTVVPRGRDTEVMPYQRLLRAARRPPGPLEVEDRAIE